MATIVRARVAHTPCNPFVSASGLEAFDDGAVAFAEGRILACGSFSDVRPRCPDAGMVDARDALLLPGFVDCHVHYPQLGAIGAMGLELLEWLRLRALPEETRLPGARRAAVLAGWVVQGWA